MAWSGSGIFNSWVRDALGPTASFAGKLASDTFNGSLYNNTVVPDNTIASASTAYNTGQWVTGNEVTDPNWTAGGRALTGVALSAAGLNYVALTASNLAGAGNVTLANVYGDMVYDFTLATPVAKQGLAFHFFGGVQGVTAGTFTVLWNASGVVRWTHAVA